MSVPIPASIPVSMVHVLIYLEIIRVSVAEDGKETIVNLVRLSKILNKILFCLVLKFKETFFCNFKYNFETTKLVLVRYLYMYFH